MRHTGVAPIRDTNRPIPNVDVVQVKVIVLDRFGYARSGQFHAELIEATSETAQPCDLDVLEGQVLVQKCFVAARQRCYAKVGDAVVEVVPHVGGLAPLELRVARQEGKPGLWRVAQGCKLGAGVAKEKPRPIAVAAKNLGDQVWPTGGEQGRQDRFERLYGTAGFEPRRATFERNSQDGGPGAFTDGLNRPSGRHERPNPLFGRGSIHRSTMALHYSIRRYRRTVEPKAEK